MQRNVQMLDQLNQRLKHDLAALTGQLADATQQLINVSADRAAVATECAQYQVCVCVCVCVCECGLRLAWSWCTAGCCLCLCHSACEHTSALWSAVVCRRPRPCCTRRRRCSCARSSSRRRAG
jgi:hypothetical protein